MIFVFFSQSSLSIIALVYWSPPLMFFFLFLNFTMTLSLVFGGDTERHPSSRQPVHQTLNTLQIGEDYGVRYCSKGESSVTETWPGAVTQRTEGRVDGWRLVMGSGSLKRKKCYYLLSSSSGVSGTFARSQRLSKMI